MYLVCIIRGMNSKEIIRRLLQEGWIRDGGQGSHQRFSIPTVPVMSPSRIRAKTSPTAR